MLPPYTSPRAQQLTERARAFLKDVILPNELAWLKLPSEQVEAKLREHKSELQGLELWNLYHSKEHGGPGLSLTEVAQVVEVLGESPFGLLAVNAQAPDAGNLELLLEYASDHLRRTYVDGLLAGELRSCFGMTEPERAGSNPVLLDTTAVREGDEYVINGRKWFTTGADGAALCIVMAVTDPGAERPHQRASMIAVPTAAEGYTLVRNLPVMGHAGSGWLSHAEVRFDDVRVPVGNLLGEQGAGFRLAQERLGPGRIHHCMRWIGIAERSLRMLTDRAATRELKPGVVLGDQQMVQDWIAESRAEIDAARLLVLNAAYQIDQLGQKAARDAVSSIKFYTANVMLRAVDRALQAHGGLGVLDDTILSFFYREERAARIYDGTDETHKSALARRAIRRAKARLAPQPEAVH